MNNEIMVLRPLAPAENGLPRFEMLCADPMQKQVLRYEILTQSPNAREIHYEHRLQVVPQLREQHSQLPMAKALLFINGKPVIKAGQEQRLSMWENADMKPFDQNLFAAQHPELFDALAQYQVQQSLTDRLQSRLSAKMMQRPGTKQPSR